MTPDELRYVDVHGNPIHGEGCATRSHTAGACNCIYGKARAAADAWEADRITKADYYRQLTARDARIEELEKRLEATRRLE